MLTKLSIINYALINRLEVEFHHGLNSITGETGAGKSIILGALGLILGNRADLSILQNNKKKCIVEGVFNITDYNLLPFFKEYDHDYDDITILRREITPTGKSRAFINDTPVTLKILSSLGLKLIDIHSQHQNLELANHSFQLELVDAVADTAPLLSDYKELYHNLQELITKEDRLREISQKEQSDLDYWQFQFDQLEAARLTPHEQEELEQELEQLTHAEDIKKGLNSVLALIDDGHLSVTGNLKQGIKLLDSLKDFLNSADKLAERMESIHLELKDIFDEVVATEENIIYNPQKISDINERLGTIYMLQQKHNLSTVEELIELKEEYSRKIGRVKGYDDEIKAIETDIALCKERASAKAVELSNRRKESFSIIEKTIKNDLKQLGMPDTQFHAVHEVLPSLSPTGKDSISFFFSANTDIAPAEISKVASGGEMSRLMLAVKNLLRKTKALPTVIFDEIDGGISGEIALKMGAILKSFSSTTQIINITHLPQIAAKGDVHFQVYKGKVDGKTVTSMKQLSHEERIKELAHMVGGELLSETTLKTAEELLNS